MTIGQVPLSVDSWLLTGYALQQAIACSDFVEVFRGNSDIPDRRSCIDAWCLWNHLCLAHLQYVQTSLHLQLCSDLGWRVDIA